MTNEINDYATPLSPTNNVGRVTPPLQPPLNHVCLAMVSKEEAKGRGGTF